MIRIKLLAISLLVIFLSHSEVFADSDEPPLLVTEDGRDQGNCQAASTPCRTIQFALEQVGKNGQIQVTTGTFAVDDVADVVYMLSGAIDVRGVMTDGSKPTLVGVPHEFATALQAKGFSVIADTKGKGNTNSSHITAFQTQTALQQNAAATDCVGGFAGIFPCSNASLLAHIADRTPGARGADIWGFMDLNTHREYAIVGYSTGTAVFDVSDAENPREVGFVNGQSTTWRDIKVYQFWNTSESRWNAYAYVTADGASDGLFIIDLNQLPHRIERASYNSDFSSAHNVYLTDTDFATGLSISGAAPNLILAGSNLADGRFRAYSLANPSTPSFIATPATPAGQPANNRLYMHDGASMIVTDSRKDTQCVNAGSSDHCDVLFDFNESSIDIWDVTLPASPVRLSQLPYTGSAYTHSGWPTEDQQFLFIQDELDERDTVAQTTLRIVSLADLTNPTSSVAWTGPTRAIDHNGFVRGNRYYMSNYARGLSIFDISDPNNPILSGRFDTYPASDGLGFPGNWGAYPFLPSGNIALSDIDSGFYLVQDNTLTVDPGSFSFAATSFGADETQVLDVVVQRNGNSQGAVSVQWELLNATADRSDVGATNGTLNWADGDSSDRNISLVLSNDGVSEGLERVLLKLLAPTGGATLSAPAMASAFISDPAATSAAAFATDRIAVAERGFGVAVAVIQRSGSASGALSVDYAVVAGDASSGSDYTGSASGTLAWADGDATPKFVEYAVTDDGASESVELIEIQLSNASGGTIGANSTLRIDILDGDGTNNTPNAVAGSSQTVATGTTVTLNGSSSNDPDGDTLTYAWSQIQGPAVLLANADAASASFTSPTVTSDSLLRFELRVTDTSGLSDTSTANVTVTTGNIGTNPLGGGGGKLNLIALLGLLSLFLLSRRDAFLLSSARDPDQSK